MQSITSTILNTTLLSPDLFVLDISFPYPVQAGQFVMIKVPDNSKILPRPISIFNYDPKAQSLSLLIRSRGQGSILLSKMSLGQKIDIFGSLGKGFDTNISGKNIILMGGGEGIAPMLLTSELLKKDNDVSVFAGFRHQIEASTLDYFDSDLDIQYTAQDHSENCARGLITDLLDDIDEPDYIYTCGPIPMMKAIYTKVLHKKWNTKVFISMESHMACGVGACVGCTVKDCHNNSIKVCTAGPVFLAEEIFNV